MRFATGHAISGEDLFTRFPSRKMELSAGEYEKTHCDRHKEDLALKVFLASVKLIIKDIIENSATFVLPTRKKHAEIYMKKIEGDAFTECRQNGKFQDVDFLASNFTGYQMAFKYQRGGTEVEKNIYLDAKNRNKITEYTNQGKSYY